MAIRVTYRNQYTEFPNLRELHRLDPMRWYWERWGGRKEDFLWDYHGQQYANPKFRWDGTPNPMSAAWNALAMGQNVAMKSATSLGKTYWAARVAMWWLDVYAGNATVVLVGPSYQQVKDTLGAEVKKIFPKFNQIHETASWFDSVRIICDGQNLDNSKWLLYTKSKGVKKAGESLNAGLMGIHAENLLFIIDEGAKIEQSVLKAIENTVTGTNNLVVMLGNPDSIIDPLSVFSQRANTVSITASALDHPNVVLGREVVAGAVTRESIVERAGKVTVKHPKGIHYDTPIFQSRVRGITPNQSADSLIKMEWVEDAIRRGLHGEYHEVLNKEGYEFDDYSYNAVGIDVAASENGDMACVVGGDRNVVNLIHEFVCPNAGDIALNLIHGHEKAQEEGFLDYGLPSLHDMEVWGEHIGIDTVGVGTSTAEVFYREGFDEIKALKGGENKEAIPEDRQGKPIFRFENLRAQMLWQLHLDLKGREFAIAINDPEILDRLKQEAIAPKYTQSKNAITIESKDVIKGRLPNGRSPNILDALMYWNWVRKDRTTGTFSGSTRVS
jgi:hypothetical protein